MPTTTIQYFNYDHLPFNKTREVSQQVCNLAHLLEEILPDGPEKSAGMRKLLEAKDCFVRSVLP
jgi:hypothetical protein